MEEFPADRARDFARRVPFIHTPKHGSLLNVAECKVSCVASPCLAGRHIGALELLQSEIQTWSNTTYARQRGIDRRFTVESVRTKLKKFYHRMKV
jgi:hypothetical protein